MPDIRVTLIGTLIMMGFQAGPQVGGTESGSSPACRGHSWRFGSEAERHRKTSWATSGGETLFHLCAFIFSATRLGGSEVTEHNCCSHQLQAR